MHTRYFIGFIATIGLIILMIVLIFSGGGNKNKPKIAPTPKTLSSYADTDAVVSMTIDGPINANQDHQQVQVVVSNQDATFFHIQGYQGNVVNRQDFANNTNAFTNFLFALERVGFTLGNNSSSLKDERGRCPTGDRYIFEMTQNGQVLQRYWATSCGGLHTYNGAFNTTVQLFRDQIPNYDDLTSSINF